MSGQYPPLTPAEVEDILKKAGFKPADLDHTDTHYFWERTTKGRRYVVCVDHISGKKGKTFSHRLIGFMIDQSGMSKKEFYGYHR
jgi:hypothetical protein